MGPTYPNRAIKLILHQEQSGLEHYIHLFPTTFHVYKPRMCLHDKRLQLSQAYFRLTTLWLFHGFMHCVNWEMSINSINHCAFHSRGCYVIHAIGGGFDVEIYSVANSLRCDANFRKCGETCVVTFRITLLMMTARGEGRPACPSLLFFAWKSSQCQPFKIGQIRKHTYWRYISLL